MRTLPDASIRLIFWCAQILCTCVQVSAVLISTLSRPLFQIVASKPPGVTKDSIPQRRALLHRARCCVMSKLILTCALHGVAEIALQKLVHSLACLALAFRLLLPSAHASAELTLLHRCGRLV